MRTIAIEEHFLAKGFREAMQRNASSQGGGLHPAMTAERQVKLADLGTLRLKDMDMGGIDLQVISHTASGRVSLPAGEEVRLTREANDQLAAAAHPVGAYTERSAEDHENGTYSEDGVEQSIDRLETLAWQHNLKFTWHEESGTWALEPMDEEEIAAYKAATENQGQS